MEKEIQVCFEKQYYVLFNRVTDAIRELQRNHPAQAMDILVRAQQEGEEGYVSGTCYPSGVWGREDSLEEDRNMG